MFNRGPGEGGPSQGATQRKRACLGGGPSSQPEHQAQNFAWDAPSTMVWTSASNSALM